jgi:hypothetical protein
MCQFPVRQNPKSFFFNLSARELRGYLSTAILSQSSTINQQQDIYTFLSVVLDKNLTVCSNSSSCHFRSFFYNMRANSNGMCSANLTVDMASIDLSEKHRNVESSNVHCMTLCRDNTFFAATEKTESRYKTQGRKTSQVGHGQD